MNRKSKILPGVIACAVVIVALVAFFARDFLFSSQDGSLLSSDAATSSTGSAPTTSTSEPPASTSEPPVSTSEPPASTSAPLTTTKTPPATTKATSTTTKAPSPKTYDPASISELMTSKITDEVPALSISKGDFIKYTYGRLNFRSNFILLYDFCDDMYTGLGTNMDESVSGEMYLGIHAYVKDGSLFFKHYRYCKDEFTVNGTTLISDVKELPLTVKDPTEYTELITSSLPNGLYKLEMALHDVKRDKDVTASMYFYVNDGSTYLCSAARMTESRIEKAIERRTVISDLIKSGGITPENSLSTDDLCYPWHPSVGRNDVPNWINLAAEITKDEWSDGLKAFAIHEWMAKNIAYDYYKAENLNQRRASYYNDYSGKYDTYESKVGTCFDFSNIYVAMCRSVGVPAVTVDCIEHTWNLIYVNDRWVEVDVTFDAMRGIYGEDMTDYSNHGGVHRYTGYGSLEVNDRSPLYINYWLMTFDKAKNRTT